MSQFMCILQFILFFLLVVSYFFIATRKQTKWTKIGELLALYSITILFAFSQKISTAVYIISAGAIFYFNFKRKKGNERRIERFGS